MKGFFYLEDGQSNTILKYYFNAVDATVDAAWADASADPFTFTDDEGVDHVCRGGQFWDSVRVVNGIMLGPTVTGTEADDEFGSLDPITTPSLPTNLTGNEGKALVVNDAGTAYELAEVAGGAAAESELVDLDTAHYRSVTHTPDVDLLVDGTTEPAEPQITVTIPAFAANPAAVITTERVVAMLALQCTNVGAEDITMNAIFTHNDVDFHTAFWGNNAGIGNGDEYFTVCGGIRDDVEEGDEIAVKLWVSGHEITVDSYSLILVRCDYSYPEGDFQPLSEVGVKQSGFPAVPADAWAHRVEDADADVVLSDIESAYDSATPGAIVKPYPVIRDGQKLMLYNDPDNSPNSIYRISNGSEPISGGILTYRYMRIWPT